MLDTSTDWKAILCGVRETRATLLRFLPGAGRRPESDTWTDGPACAYAMPIATPIVAAARSTLRGNEADSSPLRHWVRIRHLLLDLVADTSASSLRQARER